MKKRLANVLIGLGLILIFMTGCGNSEEATQVMTNDEKTEEQDGNTSESTSTVSGRIEQKINILNSTADYEDAWQKLAIEYEKETGIEVAVQTPEAGQYASALEEGFDKEGTVSIFMLTSPSEAIKWQEYMYDMKETSVYNHLKDKTLCLQSEDRILAVPGSYECFGIIYNKSILNDYCSMDGAVIRSADQIKNIDVLMEVATDINNRKDEINDLFGYDLTGAFASSGLDEGSRKRFTEQLACLPLFYEFVADGCNPLVGEGNIDGTYLDQYRVVWDMYINTSGAEPRTLDSGALDSEMELGTHEAVFYQNGNWTFDALTDPDNEYFVTAEDLGMMPIYFGVDDANQGLCIGTDDYWAVNNKADKKDIDAALTFLEWVITSDFGRACLVNEMGLSEPYDTFTEQYAPSNSFCLDAEKYLSEGKTSIAWSANCMPNNEAWKNGVAEALMAYTEGSGDWAEVKAAFVDGWSSQWKLVN